jgi:hypothetical protein
MDGPHWAGAVSNGPLRVTLLAYTTWEVWFAREHPQQSVRVNGVTAPRPPDRLQRDPVTRQARGTDAGLAGLWSVDFGTGIHAG